jgi:hypothetical protein
MLLELLPQMHKLKCVVLLVQIVYLEQWPTLERDNSISLFGATEALKASTLRLPVTSGAKVCWELIAHIFSMPFL